MLIIFKVRDESFVISFCQLNEFFFHVTPPNSIRINVLIDLDTLFLNLWYKLAL